jgi:nitrogenase molybdenum-iron protein NifN
MAIVRTSSKACTVNPLRMSQPIGGALAFMGLRATMPLLHGSQGCTSFGLVLLVRHFREAIPLQTTAMSEIATILGGLDNVEQAILNIAKRAKPELIGICTTGVTEVKGDDLGAFIALIRAKHPELAEIALVHVATPDFKEAFQDGWSKAVTALIEQVVEPRPQGGLHQFRVNVLPGSHLTPGDLDELRAIIEEFGIDAVFVPDLAGSLDGHVPEEFTPTTLGGTPVAALRTLGDASCTIAIGEQMRAAAMALEQKTGVPYILLDRLTGLAASDALMEHLTRISGMPVPVHLRRQRSQLVDAMLDGHFFLGGRKIAIGAEPDLLWSLGSFLHEMGCELAVAVTTTTSQLLEHLPTVEVLIGDLEDLERAAAGCDLLITHAHGRQAAERLGIPFFRAGIPMFDRLGAAHQMTIGYRGTRDLIFAIGNLLLADAREPTPDTWREQVLVPSDHPATPSVPLVQLTAIGAAP